jgi:autophagy-related protein 9
MIYDGAYNTVVFNVFPLSLRQRELDNYTWYDLQKRLRDVQREQQMCIHKQDLTELDIYHRILR